MVLFFVFVQVRMWPAQKKWQSNLNVSRQSIHSCILKARFTRSCRVEVRQDLQ